MLDSIYSHISGGMLVTVVVMNVMPAPLLSLRTMFERSLSAFPNQPGMTTCEESSA